MRQLQSFLLRARPGGAVGRDRSVMYPRVGALPLQALSDVILKVTPRCTWACVVGEVFRGGSEVPGYNPSIG